MVGQASSLSIWGDDGQDARPTSNPQSWRLLRSARNDIEGLYALPFITKHTNRAIPGGNYGITDKTAKDNKVLPGKRVRTALWAWAHLVSSVHLIWELSASLQRVGAEELEALLSAALDGLQQAEEAPEPAGVPDAPGAQPEQAAWLEVVAPQSPEARGVQAVRPEVVAPQSPEARGVQEPGPELAEQCGESLGGYPPGAEPVWHLEVEFRASRPAGKAWESWLLVAWSQA